MCLKRPKYKTQFDKRPVKDGIFPCDELLEGDGIDPRYDSKDRKVANRKALQLCSQVQNALNLSLPSLADETLQNLYVSSVVPASDSTQLLVTITSGDNVDKDVVLSKMAAVSGKLRADIAGSIHRKKVPNLRFNYEISC